jgi:DNA-binding response OmpR family regulator
MKRILVIDDDDMLKAMLRKLLSKAGYEVAVAENGIDALRLQQEKPADLILTDIIMPEMEGIETIREFCKKYPATKIIAMSGGGRIDPDQYLTIARRLGAQRTFVKPFKSAEILAAVSELLQE